LPTPPLYTLSLHDALPIFEAVRLREVAGERRVAAAVRDHRETAAAREPAAREPGQQIGHLARGVDELDPRCAAGGAHHGGVGGQDRKSTRLNSSHSQISYA